MKRSGLVESPRTWIVYLSSISKLLLSRLGVTRTSITGIVRYEIAKISGLSDYQERGLLIWAPSRSFSYHDLEWQEPPTKEQRDVNSRWDLDRQYIKSLDHWSELHLRALPIATWSDENLHLRSNEMRDHKKIWTVDSSRSWTVDQGWWRSWVRSAF